MATSARSLPFVVCILCIAGCGASEKELPVYAAGGTVKNTDGSPLTGGRVEFQPIEAGNARTKPSARGHLDSEGKFQLETYKPGDGAIEGEHRVVVIGPEPMKPSDPPSPVDRKYALPETSGLKYTVTQDPAKNQFDIKLDK